MTYEFDPKVRNGGPYYERPGLKEEMVRGRWKNACEGQAPGTICYGFVFEEDPNGPDMGRRSDLQPKPGGIDVIFTDQLDIELPGMIRAATVEMLEAMRQEYWFDEQRAGGDPWIGPSGDWKRRREMVEAELRRRGVQLKPLR